MVYSSYRVEDYAGYDYPHLLLKTKVFPESTDCGLEARVVLIVGGDFLSRACRLFTEATGPGRGRGSDLCPFSLVTGFHPRETCHLVREMGKKILHCGNI